MSRDFHLGTVLSITTGCLVAPNRIDDVYDILNYMTGDNLFTHQLPRAAEECKPVLLRQHPQLADVSAEGIGRDNWEPWLAGLISRFGERLSVQPVSEGEHQHINPIAEAEAMMGPERVVVVKV